MTENQCFGLVEFFTQQYEPKFSVRSKGISRILQLDLYDFLEIIKEFPDEKEIYHYYKELVTMYKHYSVLGISCYSCKSKEH